MFLINYRRRTVRVGRQRSRTVGYWQKVFHSSDPHGNRIAPRPSSLLHRMRRQSHVR
ncbi:unnamed protein product, partial [Nesidiocoris tenuis]